MLTAQITSSSLSKVQIYHDSFSGVMSGSNVTLIFSHDISRAKDVTGTLTDSMLVLPIMLNKDGLFTDYTFRFVPVSTYNRVLTKLDARVNH